MRIRKRQVPFPLSSLSPVPLSDPHFIRSPVVQLPLHNNPHENISNTASFFDPQPSDQPNQPIEGGTNGSDWSDASVTQEEKNKKEKDCLVLLQEEEKVKRNDERRGEGESNDIRKKSILVASIENGVVPQSSSSLQAVGRWCDGEKAFPLKKRRGSFDRRVNEETITEEDKKLKSKMKTKMNKKCVQQNDNEQEEKQSKEGVDSASAKKKVRGGALMEGSRCSRVNGRGWRCCQQTLVGYSLCEHHLGKGRLRSMTSVRSRSLANSTAPKKDHSEPLSSSSSSLQEKQPTGAFVDDNSEHGNEEEDEKPLMITKKRMKLGMVKARSISSLLGQTDSAIAVADNNK